MDIQTYNVTSRVPEPFEFEKLVDRDNRIRWIQNNWHHSIYWSILYFIVIFGTKQYMKNRPAFDLRSPLIIWNLGLAVFSIGGTVRMVPGLIHIIREFGFTFSVCDNKYGLSIQPSVFWAWLFIVSKVMELCDTLFIVLRKRNLIFLHWYHHMVTLILCWYAISALVAVAHWFAVMNYTVHSFMYSYYTLSAARVKIPRKVAMLITSLQLSQMLIGTFVCYWAISTKYKGMPCNFSDNVILVSLFVYLTYVFLFARLFYYSYIKTRSAENKSVKSD